MNYLTHQQLRKLWFNFWIDKHHHYLPSVSLISHDESLILVNSGIAGIKNYFLAPSTAPANKLVNIQNCVRTNDLHNVGSTLRHLSMFEMMGNFSLGDYFKKDAVVWAWEFLTSEKWLGLPIENLYVVYYKEDKEVEKILIEQLGISPSNIIPGDKKTNFWDLGVGPCGSNLEFFYDLGIENDSEKVGIKLLSENIENDRYLEIWNIVFSDLINLGNGNYVEQKTKNIDTGAGFERILTILQNKKNCFETDLFSSALKKLEELTGEKYTHETDATISENQKQINQVFKVILDHMRTTIFLISDLLDERTNLNFQIKQGYIVRKVLRTALLKLSLFQNKFSLNQLVEPFVATMDKSHPELKKNILKIKQIIEKEEEKFSLILKNELFYKLFINAKNQKIKGSEIFDLLTSHGVPLDLMKQISKENNLTLDLPKFDQLWIEHQKKSDATARDFIKNWDLFQTSNENKTEFFENENTMIVELIDIFVDNKKADSIKDSQAWISFDKTIFYAESGGQEYDLGTFTGNSNQGKILNVQKNNKGQTFHLVEVVGEINIGEKITLHLNTIKRQLTRKNHSSSHLLHSALLNILNKSYTQAGSFYNDNYLRLDFNGRIDNVIAIFKEIEDEVNKVINQKIPSKITWTTYEKAKADNVLALFEDTYDKKNVRIVSFGDYSAELCGGTHVTNTVDIEQLTITKFSKGGSKFSRLYGITSWEMRNKINEEFRDEFIVWKKTIPQMIFSIAPDFKNEVDSFDSEIQTLHFFWMGAQQKFLDLKKQKAFLVKKNEKEIINQEIQKFTPKTEYSNIKLLFQEINFKNINANQIVFSLMTKMSKHDFKYIFFYFKLKENLYKICFFDNQKNQKIDWIKQFKDVDKKIEFNQRNEYYNAIASEDFISKMLNKIIALIS